MLRLLRTFGFEEFEAELATRDPDKMVGDPSDWDRAEAALRSGHPAVGLPYVVAEGEAAFYAPKIDVHVRDAIGRRWQMSTIQVDFQFPDRFDLEYVDRDNTRRRPHVIHRALFGSVDRFFGVLLEHTAGALPAWLAPLQARVLPVRDDHDALRRAHRRPAAGRGLPGRRDRGRRAARRPHPAGQAREDPVRARGRRRRRGRGHRRRQPAGRQVERGVAVDDFVDRLAAEVAAAKT